MKTLDVLGKEPTVCVKQNRHLANKNRRYHNLITLLFNYIRLEDKQLLFPLTINFSNRMLALFRL